MLPPQVLLMGAEVWAPLTRHPPPAPQRCQAATGNFAGREREGERFISHFSSSK